MKIIFEKKIFKDFDKVDNNIIMKITAIIQNLENCWNIYQLQENFDIKKMKWENNYYRIRIWDYKLWIKVEQDFVKLIRLLHRKDIYKKFPN